MENSFQTQRKPQTEINPPQQHPFMQKTRKIIFTVALQSIIFIKQICTEIEIYSKKKGGRANQTTKLVLHCH